MFDLGLLMTVSLSSPKAPGPDPELERQRKEREEAAKKEKIEIAKKEARQASYDAQKRGRTMLSGYGGYGSSDGGGLGG